MHCILHSHPHFKTIHDIYLEFKIPMIPQATRAPAAPVVLLSDAPPSPKSSSFAWTTIARPIMECSPVREIILSEMSTSATPSLLASIFPKSPT